IEERKRAVEAVRRNEERLELALDAAHMGTWDWQIYDDEATWSVITRRMFGTEESNPDLASFYKVIHPDDRASVAEAISKAIEGRIPYEAEFRVVMPEGTRWILGKGRVSQD